jgi:hypothetical protein
MMRICLLIVAGSTSPSHYLDKGRWILKKYKLFMRKLIFNIGILSLILVSLGALAKVMHWPGASIALVIGIVGLALVFTPMALINNYKKSGSRSLFFYLIVFLTVVLLFGSALFKIQHWPGANFIFMIAMPFPFVVFLPALLVESKHNKHFSLSMLIIVLFFMAYSAVSTAMLSLNISKEILMEATLVEEELQTMNTRMKRILDRKSQAVNAGSEYVNAIQSIERIRLAVVEMPTETESRKALQNPFTIGEKDNYQAFSYVYYNQKVHLETMVKACRDIIYPTTVDLHAEMDVPAVISSEYYSDYWFYKIGDNPKIWSLANLSLLQMQVLVHQNIRCNYLAIKNNP